MWYLGVGATAKITKSEDDLLTILSTTLESQGWKLRSGGRGEVEDALILGVENSQNKEVILPYPQFRQYDVGQPSVDAFSSYSDGLQRKACGTSEVHYLGGKIISPLHKNLLGSGASLVLGKNLSTPVRFGITIIRNIGAPADTCKGYLEGPMFRLMREHTIPLFNLAYPPHLSRILDFINNPKVVGQRQV